MDKGPCIRRQSSEETGLKKFNFFLRGDGTGLPDDKRQQHMGRMPGQVLPDMAKRFHQHILDGALRKAHDGSYFFIRCCMRLILNTACFFSDN